MEEITREIINAIYYMISISFEAVYKVLAVFGGICLVSTIIFLIVLVMDSKEKGNDR